MGKICEYLSDFGNKAKKTTTKENFHQLVKREMPRKKLTSNSLFASWTRQTAVNVINKSTK